MEKVKTTKEYTIFKKRNGKYAILNNEKKYIHGQDKIQILLKEKLLELCAPKAKEADAPAAEAPAA